MIQTPVIVTFANQKGGVGKTTLCVTFANYLVTKGVRVVVIDCDFQHSIMKCRKADIRKYGEQEMPYEVWAYEANDKAMMTAWRIHKYNVNFRIVVQLLHKGSHHRLVVCFVCPYLVWHFLLTVFSFSANTLTNSVSQSVL